MFDKPRLKLPVVCAQVATLEPGVKQFAEYAGRTLSGYLADLQDTADAMSKGLAPTFTPQQLYADLTDLVWSPALIPLQEVMTPGANGTQPLTSLLLGVGKELASAGRAVQGAVDEVAARLSNVASPSMMAIISPMAQVDGWCTKNTFIITD